MTLLSTARSVAVRVRPYLPAERVVVARAFDCALGAAAWFVPAWLLTVGTPLPVIGVFGGLWLVLGRPEHGRRLLAAAGLDATAVRHALAVAGVTVWTLAPIVAPLSGVPVWAWFYLGVLGIAPYGGRGSRPDALTVLLGSALGPLLALVALTPLLAAGGLVAGLQTVFAITAALGVLSLSLGVPRRPLAVPTLSLAALTERVERLSRADRRLLLADGWTRGGLALVGPVFVAFSIQRLGDGMGEGAAVVAACLALGVVAAATVHRLLPRLRAASVWTPPTLAVGGLVVSTTAPLAVLLAPATPLAFAGTFLAVGVGQAGWTVLADEVDAVLGDHHATYRAARAVGLALAASVGGVLFAVDPAVAFVLASAAGVVGTGNYLRRVAA
ncbi:hypothetical protein [Halomarina rubra]|uniref:MFS transporter n=1 Tax=Halomarina rubra TaxID=2071873 RepID=A0ABD6ATV0_9EURY|nr:hypothetical protein [Halomarina rubra]